MEVIYLLIPLAILLVVLIIAAFFWAVRSGQFDDMEGPAHRILLDDDKEMEPGQSGNSNEVQERNKKG